MSSNQLTEIKGLEQLTQLIKLDLSSNKFTEIKGLEQLTQLTKLDLRSNKFTEIKGLETGTQLTELNLNSNKLTEIKGLEKLTQLTNLRLYDNQLTEIKGLEKLTQLTDLVLGLNRLIEIQGLEPLTQLKSLYLNNNEIREIEGLEQLTQLAFLELSCNQIAEIKGLDQLTQLIELYLYHNKLKKIKGLDQLTKLNTLKLYNNQLTEIKGLDRLTQLTSLWFNNNRITEIPECLLKWGLPIFWDTDYSKSGICVEGNPFTNPPPEIIKQGNKAIQEYFDQRKKSGEELLNEAKLILLGDGRSGKTSLANRLLGKDLPKEADRTQGVDIVIGEYSFPLSNGKDFKINIWDFAGQDKYKTLHQLFYTESSLYVMVAESGNMTTDYDDWFQTAALFGEGSPLVVVLNEFKRGIGMGSFDSNYWKKQFPGLLKEVFTVNLGTKQNFSSAEEYIRLLAQTLPHTKYAFPSNWVAIRRVLNERRNEQYITLKEYFKICKDNNLPERESALVLSSVLHKVGDCLHYQKSELLKQFIILKNEWATEAVYKILDDKVVAEDKCGFFGLSDLGRIWDSVEYEDMRPQLLELMKQFKLAYQLPGKEEFVTPPLLPPACPAGFSWPNVQSLKLYIEYEFLPKALLTQFIVTRHGDIAEGRTLVWRHGVILKWKDEALAEISKTKLQGRDAFHIRTQGNNRKGMMTVILKTFRELHAEYKGIKYKEKVPCTCEGCRTGKNKQHYFDFANLQFRLEKGRFEVECDNSLETVNVIELLENTFVFERFKEGHALQLKEHVVRESQPEIRILNLFLASSNELISERQKIEQALGRKNKLLRKQGFSIELLIWEDGKYIGKSLRSQDNYNLEIKQCDLFAMMFYSKVGKYSFEEFELATSLFERKEMPKMRVFQKDIDLPKSQSKTDAESRFSFLELLQKKEHFPILFQNTDKLVNELEDAIDKLLHDEAFIKELKVE
ncbi:MAG: small GTP-binding protein [Segetibacter sp.]|nr:small GTP-binding protein [Segetibacter sp.]